MPADPNPGFTSALAQFADNLTQILEVATGHREKAIAAGYSPTAAEAMAENVHREMLRLILGAAGK